MKRIVITLDFDNEEVDTEDVYSYLRDLINDNALDYDEFSIKQDLFANKTEVIYKHA